MEADMTAIWVVGVIIALLVLGTYVLQAALIVAALAWRLLLLIGWLLLGVAGLVYLLLTDPGEARRAWRLSTAA
jgi:hypothetical protein